MSDRDTILQALRTAQSRIRRAQALDRLAYSSCVFLAVGIFVKLVGLFILLNPNVLRIFWSVWFVSLGVTVFRNLKHRSDLAAAAGDLDRKAQLHDEVRSAYWFIGQKSSSPWVRLQIGRAASTISRLDLRRLYPYVVPRSSYLAALGLVLLFVLNFAPLPFTPNLTFSTPVPDLAVLDRQARLNEIEALLAEAAALTAPDDAAISEFQQLIDQMRDNAVSLDDTARQAESVESLIDEGNLNVNSLLEGLEDIGEDLQRAEDAAAAGEALSEGDLQAAAEEFQRLAEELGGGSPTSNELQEALAEAADNSRTGLEDLVEALEAAADALSNEDSAALEQSLSEAAESIDQISDMVTSQQLQNQAAAQMEALREALRQEQSQPAGEGNQDGAESGSSGESEQGQEPGTQAGDAAGSTPQEGEGGAAQEGFEPGGAEGSSELVPGQAPEGAASGQTAPPISGDLQNMEPTGSGDTPTGLGFSPDQKTGAPTSLEVQLQLQATMALPAEDQPQQEPDPEQEATRQERSGLDYRNVPSELTPAQQELLNQERIPREYQNVIKEYFQAIRPTSDETDTP